METKTGTPLDFQTDWHEKWFVYHSRYPSVYLAQIREENQKTLESYRSFYFNFWDKDIQWRFYMEKNIPQLKFLYL